MRTYHLPAYQDGESICVEIELDHLPVIIAALNHCARKSHVNVLRDIRQHISTLLLVLEQFEEIVEWEKQHGRRQEVDQQDD